METYIVLYRRHKDRVRSAVVDAEDEEDAMRIVLTNIEDGVIIKAELVTEKSPKPKGIITY